MLRHKLSVTIVIIAVLSLVINTAVFAATPSYLINNGKSIKFSNTLMEEADSIYFPVAETISKLGGTVSWNGILQLVTIEYEGTKIVIKPNSNNASKNGVPFLLTNVPINRDGRLYLPISFLNETLNVIAKYEKTVVGRFLYISKPTDTFSYLSQEIRSVQGPIDISSNKLIISYPSHIVVLETDNENISVKRLPTESNVSSQNQKIVGFKDFTTIESLKWDGKQYILNIARQEQDYAYKKYANRSLKNSISTQKGVYKIYQYEEDMRQFYFNANGVFTGYGKNKEQGLLIQKDDKLFVGKPFGSGNGDWQKYMFVDQDRLFIVNKAGNLVKDYYVKMGMENVHLLDLGLDDAVAIIGFVKEKGYYKNKVYCEFYGLNDVGKRANWHEIDIENADTMEITSVEVKDEKVLFTAKSGGNVNYVGIIDNKNYTHEVKTLPGWVNNSRIVVSEGKYYLLWANNEIVNISGINI